MGSIGLGRPFASSLSARGLTTIGPPSKLTRSIGCARIVQRPRAYMKHHHLQTGVGHYGVFAGRRWSSYIYPILPILRNVIYASD
jgi:hypothetical protein